MLNEAQKEILEYVMNVPVRVKLYSHDDINPKKGFIQDIDYSSGIIRYSGHYKGITHNFNIEDLYFVDYANKSQVGQYRLSELFPERENPEKFTKGLKL